MRRRPGGVIDRRGAGSSGGFGGLPLSLGGGLSAGGLLVVLLVVGALWLFGGQDSPLGDVLDPFGDAGTVGAATGPQPDPDDPIGTFVDSVNDDIQTAWTDLFARAGLTYEPTSVVLFTGQTQTACGVGSSSTGPFYCPADRLVYLDASFFRTLEREFGVQGDFAQAYVIAHEIGHHVQTLLGIESRVRAQMRDDPALANELSVRLELQADCFAGVWARSAQSVGILQPGDLEEGLNAASAIGDDAIQEATEGRVHPESFTHGTSEQRATWLRTGVQVGNPDACDTFVVPYDQL
ncbi:MAG: neutral zinc metallopeptidase [Actinobacteria bacterium]|nr:neutral zinc metallopeptidase [Actinomycetota bacterium]